MDPTTPAVVDIDVVSFLFKSHPLAPATKEVCKGVGWSTYR